MVYSLAFQRYRILGFRVYNFEITGDVSKMYRHILIDKNERCFQRILWQNYAFDELESHELYRVTYDTASAPNLSVKCLQKVANENAFIFPVSSKIIKMILSDHLIVGADLKSEISLILNSAVFELKKWSRNEFTILQERNLTRNLDNNI